MRKRLVDSLVLVSLVLVSMVINLPAYLAVSDNRAMLNILSLDEWAYADFMNSTVYGALKPFTPIALATLHDPWGYGSIFWYVYSIAGMPAHYLGSFTAEIVSYRLFSAFWLGVSAWLLYKMVKLITQKHVPAIAAGFILFLQPGFYFYDKAFSAEFFHLALSLASIYALMCFVVSGKRAWAYGAALLLGIAMGVKVSVIVFVPVMALAFIWQERQRFWWKGLQGLLYCGALSIAGFFVANPYVLLLRREGVNIYLSLLKQNMLSNATNHGGSVEGINALTWIQGDIFNYFFPVAFSIVLLLAWGIVLYQQRHKQWLAISVPLASWLLYTGYIIFTVKKTWLWYLFPGMALFPLAIYFMDYSVVSAKVKWATIAGFSIFSGVLLMVNVHQIQLRYQEMLGREQQASFAVKQIAKTQFDAWLPTTVYSGTFLKSPYIYFDETKFLPEKEISVATIWGSQMHRISKRINPHFY